MEEWRSNWCSVGVAIKLLSNPLVADKSYYLHYLLHYSTISPELHHNLILS